MSDQTLDYGPLQGEFQREWENLDGLRGRELVARRLDLQERFTAQLARVQETAKAYNLPDDLAARLRADLDALPNGGRGFQHAVQRHDLEARYRGLAQERQSNQVIDQTAAQLGVSPALLQLAAMEANNQQQSKMDQLRAAYKAELAKIPRGQVVAVSLLQDRYRHAGLDV